jgi:hypothetical protein
MIFLGGPAPEWKQVREEMEGSGPPKKIIVHPGGGGQV